LSLSIFANCLVRWTKLGMCQLLSAHNGWFINKSRSI